MKIQDFWHVAVSQMVKSYGVSEVFKLL